MPVTVGDMPFLVARGDLGEGFTGLREQLVMRVRQCVYVGVGVGKGTVLFSGCWGNHLSSTIVL